MTDEIETAFDELVESLQVAASGTLHTSYWKAEQARRFDLALDVAAAQVAELAELTEAAA